MKNKWITGIVFIFITVIIFAVAVYSVFSTGSVFFHISVFQVLSLLFVLYITYFLSQRRNDERRKIDIVDKMIFKIQEDVVKSELINYKSEEDKSMALLLQKSIANRLEYLNDSKIGSDIKGELEYIIAEVEKMREFYGSHMNDEEYMKKSSNDFRKYIVNISDKCNLMHIKLYE